MILSISAGISRGGGHDDVVHGDVCRPLWRRASGKKGALLAQRLVETQSPIVRKLGNNRACTVGFGRFLGNRAVMPDEVFAAAGAATGVRAAGRHVLAIQDTTHLSFPRRAGGTLGPGGDGTVPGLFLHPVLALDASDGTALGLAAGRVWTRRPGKVTARRKRALADKESMRWIEAGAAAKAALAEARQVTLIADRESDIYEAWAALPDARFALLTRASRDRKLAGGERLFAATADWPEADRIVLDLPPRKGRPARRALLALKYGTVRICRPRHCSTPGLAKTVTLQLVEVEELAAAPGEAAIHWRLLTTHAVTNTAKAHQIIAWYRQRWRIEEYFRVLKRSGIDLEAAMVEGAHALLNLVAMAAVAGVAVMQLVEGRDAGPERRAGEVIAADELDFALALNRTLEGRTDKQKNPHQQGSLAWLSWIVARLGGWSGYRRYGPPGPKTIAYGWDQFKTMSQGWNLRKNV
ncbi:MAG: IS4 family transposase [Kiloniellales bacterium]